MVFADYRMTMRKALAYNLTLFWVAAVVFGLASAAANAEEGTSPWTFEVGAYAFVPISIDGTSTVDGGAVDLDLGPSDIFDLLEFAIAGRFEAWRASPAGDGSGLGFILDATYVDLGLDESGIGPGSAGDVDADIRQGIVDFMVAYRFPHLQSNTPGLRYTEIDLMAGARYNYLKQEIDVTPGLPVPFTLNLGGDRDWVSPVIGARANWVFNETWNLVLRGDMSGFGVSGEDLSWSITALAGYKIGEQTTLRFGYRVYDIDYSDGSGADEFALDVTQHGPFIGLSYRF